MSQRFLIHHVVEFWPERGSLVARHSDKEVILSVPARRCLQLMLTRLGECVPHTDFYNYVWGPDGKNVTPNNLYQTISVLRRGLREAHLYEPSIILTVPKVGFKINERINIEVISEENTLEEDIFLKTEKINNANKNAAIQVKKNNLFLKVLFSFSMTLLFVTAYVSFQMIAIPNNFKYYYTVSINGCEFFFGARTINEKEKERGIKNYIGDCKKRPYVYIYSFDAIPYYSVIACDKKLNFFSNAYCVSTRVRTRGVNER